MVANSIQKGRLFGYARVSTDDQNLSLQIDALEKHGVNPASSLPTISLEQRVTVQHYLPV